MASDCIAIAYVLKRRAARIGVSVAEHTHDYSLRKRTPRAAFARQLPDGDEPTWSADVNARWAKLRGLAAEALAGRVKNVCPRATDWGGMKLEPDRRRALRAIEAGRWRVVKCSAETVNTYFASGGGR